MHLSIRAYLQYNNRSLTVEYISFCLGTRKIMYTFRYTCDNVGVLYYVNRLAFFIWIVEILENTWN